MKVQGRWLRYRKTKVFASVGSKKEAGARESFSGHRLQMTAIYRQAQGLGRAADDKKKIREQVSKKMRVHISKEAYVDTECGYPTTEGGQYPAAVRGDQSTEGGCGEAVPGS